MLLFSRSATVLLLKKSLHQNMTSNKVLLLLYSLVVVDVSVDAGRE